MLKKILLGSFLFVWASSTHALCIKTPLTGGDSWPVGWEPFDSTTGISTYWPGASQMSGGGMKIGSVNIASEIIQPVGSMIGDGGPVPLTSYGLNVGYQPEQVLFLCSPDEEGFLYEGFIATNTNYMRSLITEPGVPENVRTTYIQRIGWRLTHLETGQYFTDKWQLRPLTGLDRDIYGRILVKAKNFSDVQLQYFRTSHPTTISGGYSYSAPNKGLWGAWDPFGWVVLISHNNTPPTSKIPRCLPGQTLPECSYGSYGYVPGAISNITSAVGGDGSGFTTYKGCQITHVTPSVTFPSMTLSEVENGSVRTGTIQINFSCENGASLSTLTGGNAIGFKVTDNASLTARNLGFGVAGGTGVTKLFSENYSNTDVAKGVAIELYSPMEVTPMNWLTGTTKGGRELNGWYSPSALANNPGSTLLEFSTEYTVKLSKFYPSSSVTPGKVYANAEVFLKIQ
ncbi:fimbrial protein [Shewanella xiamenensis]|uniref:fimbrial protein n=1 Tax=Shewanella xiamenensis TaxID=332186 RepID=UPI0035BA858D